jgi:hypothetical protein
MSDEITPAPDVMPTGQQAGATTDNSDAGTAPGTDGGPDDTTAPEHGYRRLAHGEAGGHVEGRWADAGHSADSGRWRAT